MYLPFCRSILVPTAAIMHQRTGIGYIIGMVIFDLEIVDLDRAFQQFMLNLFNNNVLTVDKKQDIASTEFGSIYPALHRGIDRMGRRCNYFLAVHENMNQLVRLIDVSLHDLFQRDILRVFIPGLDVVAHFYGLNGCSSCCG